MGNGLCNKFLNTAVDDNIEVRPEILCIGDIEELRYEHWSKTKEGDGFKKMIQSKLAHKLSIIPGIYICFCFFTS